MDKQNNKDNMALDRTVNHNKQQPTNNGQTKRTNQDIALALFIFARSFARISNARSSRGARERFLMFRTRVWIAACALHLLRAHGLLSGR